MGLGRSARARVCMMTVRSVMLWAYRVSCAHEALDVNGQSSRALSGLLGVGLLLACHGDESGGCG